MYSTSKFGAKWIDLLLCIMFAVFLYLKKPMQVWLTDIETKKLVEALIRSYLRSLYIICIIAGSAFTAIEICNKILKCKLFGYNK